MSKAAEAFRTISEVAADLDVPKHVLRFWEAKFPQVRPMKRGGGRRYYRPEDLELLRGIRHLLHAEGYTIKGVQKILREQGVDQVKAFAAKAIEAGTGRGRRKGDGSRHRIEAVVDAALHSNGAPAAANDAAAPLVVPDEPRPAAAATSGTAQGAIRSAIVELRALRAMLAGEAVAAAPVAVPAEPQRRAAGRGRAPRS